MNKKVLTLCAAMLLGGSLSTMYATDASKDLVGENQIINAVEDGVINLTGNVTCEGTNYWVITQKGLTINGNGNTLNGRLVIAAEGVTINNLTINDELTSAVLGGFYNNTAITVFADDFTLNGVKIKGKVNGGNTTNVINAITLYPQSEKPSYSFSNVEISGFNQSTQEDSYGNVWYSSAIQIYQNAVNDYADGK